MDKKEIILQMAYALEHARIGSAQGWTKEQFQCWCHRDEYGKKSFRQAKSFALKQYKALVKMGAIVEQEAKSEVEQPQLYEAYVEQFFPPSGAMRGYSSIIRAFPGLTKDEAITKTREQEEIWRPQDDERSSFYVSYRKMR